MKRMTKYDKNNIFHIFFIILQYYNMRYPSDDFCPILSRSQNTVHCMKLDCRRLGRPKSSSTITLQQQLWRRPAAVLQLLWSRNSVHGYIFTSPTPSNRHQPPAIAVATTSRQTKSQLRYSAIRQIFTSELRRSVTGQWKKRPNRWIWGLRTVESRRWGPWPSLYQNLYKFHKPFGRSSSSKSTEASLRPKRLICIIVHQYFNFKQLWRSNAWWDSSKNWYRRSSSSLLQLITAWTPGALDNTLSDVSVLDCFI